MTYLLLCAGTGAYLGLVGLLGVPGLMVAGVGRGISCASSNAVADYESSNYKKILRELITATNGQPEDVIDEIEPLENYLVVLFEVMHPTCNLLTCSMKDLERTIRSTNYSGKRDLKKIISHYPVVISKLWLVGRIRMMRQLLDNTVMIAFVGAPGTGKSTILTQLFDIDTSDTQQEIHSLHATDHRPVDPRPYRIGTWVEDALPTNEAFSSWIAADPARSQLQVYAVDFPGVSLDGLKNKSPRQVQQDMHILQSVTRQVAALASVFVVVVSADDDDYDNSRAAIAVAQDHHKPYIVVVNRCDAADHTTSVGHIDFSSQYDSACESYARKLNVPSESIFLVGNCLQDCIGIHVVRGVLFSMVHTILGSSASVSQALALRFIPNNVMDISNCSRPKDAKANISFATDGNTDPSCPGGARSGVCDLLGVVDTLGAASASILLNMRPLTWTSLRDACAEFLQQTNGDPPDKQQQQQDTPTCNAEVFISSMSPRNMTDHMRDVACHLHLDQNTYAVFMHSFVQYLDIATRSLQRIQTPYLTALNQQTGRRMEMWTVLLVLRSMQRNVRLLIECICGNCDTTSGIAELQQRIADISSNEDLTDTMWHVKDPSCTDSIRHIAAELMLELSAFMNYWEQKGYIGKVVRRAMEETLLEMLGSVSSPSTASTTTAIACRSMSTSCHLEGASSLGPVTITGKEERTMCVDERQYNDIRPSSSSGTSRKHGTSMKSTVLQNRRQVRRHLLEPKPHGNNPALEMYMLLLQRLSKHHTIVSLLSNHSHADDGHDSTSEYHDLISVEMKNFVMSKAHIAQLTSACQFQPFSDIQCSPIAWDVTKDDDAAMVLEAFHKSLRQHARINKRRLPVTLSKNTGIVLEVLNGLVSLSQHDLDTARVVFSIQGEGAVDVNGVTRAILSQVALEINTTPDTAMLRSHDDSKVVYFDPEVCASSDPVVLASADHVYAGLGRLMGLSILKAVAGATLPIRFPIAVYRLILGYPLGLADLQSISPSLATSISNICTLDSDTLDMSCLDFTVSQRDHTTIPLCPGGDKMSVSVRNRVDFVQLATRYYLGFCSAATTVPTNPSPLWRFVMAVQDVCPREYFHNLSPIALQMVVEGEWDELDVTEWRLNSSSRRSLMGGATSGTKIADTVDMFWTVVEAMNETDRRRLLCFSIGSTSLPCGGFSKLDPRFTLVVADSMSPDSLPLSHTCFHMLVIPRYGSEDIMRAKVSQAIQETGMTELGMV